jgi:hypothetical protein
VSHRGPVRQQQTAVDPKGQTGREQGNEVRYPAEGSVQRGGNESAAPTWTALAPAPPPSPLPQGPDPPSQGPNSILPPCPRPKSARPLSSSTLSSLSSPSVLLAGLLALPSHPLLLTSFSRCVSLGVLAGAWRASQSGFSEVRTCNRPPWMGLLPCFFCQVIVEVSGCFYFLFLFFGLPL